MEEPAEYKQTDLIDFIGQLDEPIIDNDTITKRVINRLMLTITNPQSLNSDVNNAAKLLLTFTGALTEKVEHSGDLSSRPVQVSIVGRKTNND